MALENSSKKLLLFLLAGFLFISSFIPIVCAEEESDAKFLGIKVMDVVTSRWFIAACAFALSYAVFFLFMSIAFKGKIEEKTIKYTSVILALVAGLAIIVSSYMNDWVFVVWSFTLLSGIPVISIAAVVGLFILLWYSWSVQKKEYKLDATKKDNEQKAEEDKEALREASSKVKKAAYKVYKYETKLDEELQDVSKSLDEVKDAAKEFVNLTVSKDASGDWMEKADYKDAYDKLKTGLSDASTKLSKLSGSLTASFKWALVMNRQIKGFPVGEFESEFADIQQKISKWATISGADAYKHFKDNVIKPVEDALFEITGGTIVSERAVDHAFHHTTRGVSNVNSALPFLNRSISSVKGVIIPKVKSVSAELDDYKEVASNLAKLSKAMVKYSAKGLD